MDVPELRCIISSYLNSHHFVQCALVCRAWNAYFTPFIYREMTLIHKTAETVRRHSAHVRKLIGRLNIQLVRVLSERRGNVRELEVHGTEQRESSLPEQWVRFFQNNPGIVKVTVRDMQLRVIKLIAGHSSNITDLTIWDLELYDWGPLPELSRSLMQHICNQLTTTAFVRTHSKLSEISGYHVHGQSTEDATSAAFAH